MRPSSYSGTAIPRQAELSDVGEKHLLRSYARWSPDGKKIVFASRRSGNGDIYVIQGDARTRLTTSPALDGEPAFLQNGRIAFTSKRAGNGDIYVMNASGTAQTRLTSSPAPDSSPDSP